ncbi:hypothetical protein H8356DRAFT_1364156 [Neocallimastix lanati (nom. inval.)]|nr:hypothetical protein H8356DRAFT_1364156 [Neocallimastix sp. JGI-2020a]
MIYSIIDMEGKTVYYYSFTSKVITGHKLLFVEDSYQQKIVNINRVDDNTDNRINRFIQEYINKNIINIIIKEFLCNENILSKPNTRISKYKILILEHLIPWLIRKVSAEILVILVFSSIHDHNSSHYSKISFSAMNYMQHFITLFVISYWAYTGNASALQLQVQLLFIHVNNFMIEIRYVTRELSLDRLEVTMNLLHETLGFVTLRKNYFYSNENKKIQY